MVAERTHRLAPRVLCNCFLVFCLRLLSTQRRRLCLEIGKPCAGLRELRVEGVERKQRGVRVRCEGVLLTTEGICLLRWICPAGARRDEADCEPREHEQQGRAVRLPSPTHGLGR